MDLIGIAILLLIMFFVSLLWRYWLNGFLKATIGENFGVKPAAPRFEFDPIAYNEYMTKFLGKGRIIPDSELGLMRLTTVTPKIGKPVHIERDVKVEYHRSIYVNKAFPLTITIAPKGKKVSRKENQMETEQLSFEAFEKEPKVTVELKFSEGDFRVNKNKKSQKLAELENTVFNFMVTPLKSEDSVLTIVFSYTDKIPLPGKTTEKVIINKIMTPEQGKSTKEHSEQTTIIPVQIVEKEIELKSMDLVISVKSLFGLDAKQLDLLKRSAVGVGALIILAYGILSGELEGTDAIISAFVSLLPIFGVEGVDKLFGNKNKETEDA